MKFGKDKAMEDLGIGKVRPYRIQTCKHLMTEVTGTHYFHCTFNGWIGF